ncbi:MAG TPA: hypothetical protein DCY94_01865, partial [Firmicutes bacterium]|nr:hypothetical protein [Bacillota bacterium]
MENNMQTNSDLVLSEKEKIRQFILSNIDNIKEAGVFLLRPMSARQRMLFSLVAKEFPNILAYCIGEGEDRR